MKAQCDVAEDSGKAGATPTSFSATDCLRISATFKPQSKNAAGRARVCHKKLFRLALLGPH
jgi:hypothetical protein